MYSHQPVFQFLIKAFQFSLRFLLSSKLSNRGCKFVGHGLRNDFHTVCILMPLICILYHLLQSVLHLSFTPFYLTTHQVNLFVPPCQIIDTLHIFHLKGRRYISLRFLVNYLLQRDMQVEIHDSIEDSRAANELYLKALEFKENGSFDEILRKIYERGNQTDWKVAELTR